MKDLNDVAEFVISVIGQDGFDILVNRLTQKELETVLHNMYNFPKEIANERAKNNMVVRTKTSSLEDKQKKRHEDYRKQMEEKRERNKKIKKDNLATSIELDDELNSTFEEAVEMRIAKRLFYKKLAVLVNAMENYNTDVKKILY